MGGLFSKPKTPAVVQQDPKADQLRAEAETQVKANADLAARRKSRRSSSLLASYGGAEEAATQSALASGKAKLGE